MDKEVGVLMYLLLALSPLAFWPVVSTTPLLHLASSDSRFTVLLPPGTLPLAAL